MKKPDKIILLKAKNLPQIGSLIGVPIIVIGDGESELSESEIEEKIQNWQKTRKLWLLKQLLKWHLRLYERMRKRFLGY